MGQFRRMSAFLGQLLLPFHLEVAFFQPLLGFKKLGARCLQSPVLVESFNFDGHEPGGQRGLARGKPQLR